MTLPASGTISIQSLNTEINRNVNTMNDSRLRNLAGITATNTTIALSNFYSKTGKFTGNITTDGTPRSTAGISGAAFYGGTFLEIMRNSSNGNAEIHFNTTPTNFGTGNIILLNNTTGISSSLPFLNSVNWSGSNPANLIRSNVTDNFTIYPA